MIVSCLDTTVLCLEMIVLCLDTKLFCRIHSFWFFYPNWLIIRKFYLNLHRQKEYIKNNRKHLTTTILLDFFYETEQKEKHRAPRLGSHRLAGGSSHTCWRAAFGRGIAFAFGTCSADSNDALGRESHRKERSANQQPHNRGELCQWT